MKSPPKSSKASQSQVPQYEQDSEEIAREAKYAESVPPIDPLAYYGSIGTIALKAGEYTEADPKGVLLCCLVAFGSAVGRDAYFQFSESRHYANEFAVLVGATARARKGLAIDIAKAVIYRADPEWAINRIVYGFNSGEGVVHKVRDPKITIKLDKEGKKEEKILDPGVEDKRCLCISTEFGEILTLMSREGAILTSILRNAWDGAPKLEINTRQHPISATDASVALFGAITSDELGKLLPKIPDANGFANRFLWAMVAKTRFLPNGGPSIEDYAPQELLAVHRAMVLARSIREMKRSSEAEKRWNEIYRALEDDRDHAVIHRGPAHVLRLSMLYALADGSEVISSDHLEAALALWNYCKESALRLFHTYKRPADSQKVYDHLQRNGAQGATRTDISTKVFRGHKTTIEISHALMNLKDEGVVRVEREVSDQNHRVERWFAIPLSLEKTSSQ